MRPSSDGRFAALLLAPTLAVVAAVALFPLIWTFWESFHLHDLRMPWRGRPFIGLANYREALASPRFWGAFSHTAGFTALSVALEIVLGLSLALILDRAFRGRGPIRAVVLLPWALPTVVAALLWRFLFAGDGGLVNRALLASGLAATPVIWLARPLAAWVPLVLADVWKTTPFVALLFLAGLQTVDPRLHEAARLDGAGAVRRFVHVTLPHLVPVLLVALVFRTLDAFRIFDLVYVLTGGGPGTATETVALYTFDSLLQDLRFGYGSALSVLVFVVTLGLALLYLRSLGAGLTEGEP